MSRYFDSCLITVLLLIIKLKVTTCTFEVSGKPVSPRNLVLVNRSYNIGSSADISKNSVKRKLARECLDGGVYVDNICQPCPGGMFWRINDDAVGGSECQPCPPGTFSTPGSLERADCRACPLGFYAENEASTVCSSCGPHTTTMLHSSTLPGDCFCASGYKKRSRYTHDVPPLDCLPCASDEWCLPGNHVTSWTWSDFCSSSNLENQEFGRSPLCNSVGDQTRQGKCYASDQCPSTLDLKENRPSCIFPHRGVKCRDCARGYAPTLLGGLNSFCIGCSAHYAILALFIIGLSVVAILLMLALRDKEATNCSVASVLSRISLEHWQTLNMLRFAHIQWSGPFGKMMQFFTMGFPLAEIFSCTIDSNRGVPPYHAALHILMFFPLLLGLWSILLTFIAMQFPNKKIKEEGEDMNDARQESSRVGGPLSFGGVNVNRRRTFKEKNSTWFKFSSKFNKSVIESPYKTLDYLSGISTFLYYALFPSFCGPFFDGLKCLHLESTLYEHSFTSFDIICTNSNPAIINWSIVAICLWVWILPCTYAAVLWYLGQSRIGKNHSLAWGFFLHGHHPKVQCWGSFTILRLVICLSIIGLSPPIQPQDIRLEYNGGDIIVRGISGSEASASLPLIIFGIVFFIFEITREIFAINLFAGSTRVSTSTRLCIIAGSLSLVAAIACTVDSNGALGSSLALTGGTEEDLNFVNVSNTAASFLCSLAALANFALLGWFFFTIFQRVMKHFRVSRGTRRKSTSKFQSLLRMLWPFFTEENELVLDQSSKSRTVRYHRTTIEYMNRSIATGVLKQEDVDAAYECLLRATNPLEVLAGLLRVSLHPLVAVENLDNCLILLDANGFDTTQLEFPLRLYIDFRNRLVERLLLLDEKVLTAASWRAKTGCLLRYPVLEDSDLQIIPPSSHSNKVITASLVRGQTSALARRATILLKEFDSEKPEFTLPERAYIFGVLLLQGRQYIHKEKPEHQDKFGLELSQRLLQCLFLDISEISFGVNRGILIDRFLATGVPPGTRNDGRSDRAIRAYQQVMRATEKQNDEPYGLGRLLRNRMQIELYHEEITREEEEKLGTAYAFAEAEPADLKRKRDFEAALEMTQLFFEIFPDARVARHAISGEIDQTPDPQKIAKVMQDRVLVPKELNRTSEETFPEFITRIIRQVVGYVEPEQEMRSVQKEDLEILMALSCLAGKFAAEPPEIGIFVMGDPLPVEGPDGTMSGLDMMPPEDPDEVKGPGVDKADSFAKLVYGSNCFILLDPIIELTPLPVSNLVSGEADWTIEAWIYLPLSGSEDSIHTLLCSEAEDSLFSICNDQFGVCLQASSEGFIPFGPDGPVVKPITIIDLESPCWHYVTVSAKARRKSPSDPLSAHFLTLRLFIDGNLGGKVELERLILDIETVGNTKSAQQPFGTFSGICVLSRCLNASQVLRRYQSRRMAAERKFLRIKRAQAGMQFQGRGRIDDFYDATTQSAQSCRRRRRTEGRFYMEKYQLSDRLSGNHFSSERSTSPMSNSDLPSQKEEVMPCDNATVQKFPKIPRRRLLAEAATESSNGRTQVSPLKEMLKGRRRRLSSSDTDKEFSNNKKCPKWQSRRRLLSDNSEEEEEEPRSVIQQRQHLDVSDPPISRHGASTISDDDDRAENLAAELADPVVSCSARLHRASKKRLKSSLKPCESKTYHLTKKCDTSFHNTSCYVCGLPTINTCESRFCSGCLLSYHSSCLSSSTVNGDKDDWWLCPKCNGDFVPRRVQFSRYGQPTRASARLASSESSYREFVIGLTGKFSGCGRCGQESSQRRIAVICDNCDREFHLKCLNIAMDDLPWGNWLCPDCSDLHICAACVLNKRKIREDDSDTVPSEPAYHHEGSFLRCNVCTLQYHFECARTAVGLHRKPETSSAKEGKRAQQIEEAADGDSSSSVANSWNLTTRNKVAEEFWCCSQCQEHFGVQKIYAKRNWSDLSSDGQTTQSQLLIKLKGLSYRTLMWLPLHRLRSLYATGLRKWQAAFEPGGLDIEGGRESVAGGESGDNTDTTEDINCHKKNSSSIQKVQIQPEDDFFLSMKKPPDVKIDWLRVDRVISQRRCPRGSSKIQFLVKWRSLPYEEATWENVQTVQQTRALKLFFACDAIDRIIAEKPDVLVRNEDDDPTQVDTLSSIQEASSPTEGTLLSPGCRFVLQTSASGVAGKSNDILSQRVNIYSTDQQEEEIEVACEKRRARFAIGAFVPYSDRPKFLRSKILYDYQLEGINWLRFAWNKRRSVILADEMGLGKTVQVISFLGSLWNDSAVQGPFLIIAPLATLEDVWLRELSHWAPFINAVAYFGNPEGRTRCFENDLFAQPSATADSSEWIQRVFVKDLEQEFDRQTFRPRVPKLANKDRFAKFDAIVTSYEIFRKDHVVFRQIDWKLIIVDEGHRLKSFSSEVKRALESCTSEMRLLLTGTPLQNSIDELFSLLNVLHPDKFPESSKENYQDLTQDSTIEKLKLELQSHILRRTKKDVMGGRMPAKKERLLLVENAPQQKEMYRNIILRNHFALGATSSMGGKKSARVTSLRNIVMQMRKCCNHPVLFEDCVPAIRTEEEFRDFVHASGKLTLLDRMLAILKPRGHRVLIFSQFMKLLDILEEYLNYKKYGYERLDGSTSAVDRQRAIDRFNTQVNKKFAFLLSTRAGGLGINLTSADTVILYDSDWNPHNDLQAQARAHRLGQTKKVAIYRFMTRASVEERMIEIAKNKLVLDQVVAGKISLRDVEAVVRCGAKELFEETPAKEITYDDQQLLQVLDRGNDDEVDEKASAESNFDEGVLDAFKVAHFEEAGGDDAEDDNGDFWKSLITQKESPRQMEDNFNFEDESLGRGMRARREVAHYGQERTRDNRISGNEDDDDDDDDVDEEDEEEETSNDEDGDTYGDPRVRLLGKLPVDQKTTQLGVKKLKKSNRPPSDPLELFAILICQLTSDDHFDIKRILDRRNDRIAFREAFPDSIPGLLEQVRIVRKSLGLSETLRTTRPIELPTRFETTGEIDCRVGFGLIWDLKWLTRLIETQRDPRLNRHPPFIVQHSNRYFLLCKPLAIKSPPIKDESLGIQIDDFVTIMRELLTEELSKWQCQLGTALHRSITSLSGNLRSDVSRQKQILAMAWGVSGGGHDLGKVVYTEHLRGIESTLRNYEESSDSSSEENIEDAELFEQSILAVI